MMATTFIHATITLDGFMADPDGSIDWMFGRPSDPGDDEVISEITSRIGAIVGGGTRAQIVEDGEEPYGGGLGVPVFLMTHREHPPIVKNGSTYTFVVDDIARAVALASEAAGDRWVSLLGGSIGRQCLRAGLVDEIHLSIAPVLLGDGIPLFAGLGQRVELERLDTRAFAAETHVRYRVLR